MTTQQIKEQVGKHLFFMVASQMSCKISELYLDNGVDFMLVPVRTFHNEFYDSNRILDSGAIVAIQLKCTTQKYIQKTMEHLKYDLEAKSFNDLVLRRNDRHQTKSTNVPLLLMLAVFNTDKHYLLSFNDDNINIKADIYWFYPQKKDNFTKNVSKTRIKIPLKNRITFDNFYKMFEL